MFFSYNQQKCIAHSSGGWQSEIRAPALSSEQPFPGLRLGAVASHGEGGQGALWGPIYEGADPTHEGGASLMASSPSRGPTHQYYLLWGLGILWGFFFCLISFYFILVYSITIVAEFSPLLFSVQLISCPSVNPHTIVRVHGSFIHVL